MMPENNYVLTHCHTSYSLLDSCTSYQEMIDTAVQHGMKAIAITEHGLPRGWVNKALYCKQKGVKFLHGVEIYLTEQLEPKVRDNFHTVLIAKNAAGIRELNELVSKSTDEAHFYYNNRISLDEFLGISDNIIKTSACLASPLNKLPHDHPRYMELAQHYDFLEIQPHDDPEQKAFNAWLVDLAQKIGKPLIVGTDTHSSSAYKAECRQVLLEAKGKNYPDDKFNLTFMSYEELIAAMEKQGIVSKEVYMEAIENTNRVADMCDEIEIDTSIKSPVSYGSPEADEKMFEELVKSKLDEKIKHGVIPETEIDGFKKAIEEEMRVFRKLGMIGFLLSMSELISWCKAQGYAIGPARGSVGGSRVAYVTDIIDLDPERWHTNFARFANEHRQDEPDIDIDCIESDRPFIFKHIVEQFGSAYTARVGSYGTIQEKGAIDEIGRCLAKRWAKTHENDSQAANPWSLKVIDKIKSEYEADPEKTKQKYKELFYYFQGIAGTIISQSVHPAGIIISPITLADNYGVFNKDGELCIMLDMSECHEVKLIKYDMLVLKTVAVIRDCCRYAGIPYPKTSEIDFDDPAIWDDLAKDTTMIFQFDGSYASESLRKFRPRSIFDMSMVTACIRPSGASYRNDLLAHKIHKNPSDVIDKVLADSNGYLIYQESIIDFLVQACGLDGSTADTVRRGIAKKKIEVLEEKLPDILSGYCSKSDKPRDVAERECQEYLQVITDASSYMFGYNHSIAYCIVGYYTAYFRHYYPVEFVTAFLNNAANDDDIQMGTAFANKHGIKVVTPKFGISRGEWYFDKEKQIIAKGLNSVKYMSPAVSWDILNIVSQNVGYNTFTDLLYALHAHSSLDARQINILISIDFFSDFGNQTELSAIYSTFADLFKFGEAKQLARGKIDGTAFEAPVRNHSTWLTKAGKEAASYKLTDAYATLIEIEAVIKGMHLADASIHSKIQAQQEYFGHIAATGEEADRRTLVVDNVYDLHRKKDGKLFGYSVIATSIGSGKQTRYTVFCRDWNRCGELDKGEIIHIEDYKRDGEYFQMTDYTVL